ncbi:MAG: folate family ECF transporter S component [Eubacterium sp.]|nr:folate family ECF transporter S component [Eubacterium sp.]
MSKRFNVKSVAILGILVAAEIIFARFSIHTWNLKIGFSFVPIVIAAVLYGPIAGGMVAAIGDVISAFLFPVGAFFPGFTLTAFLAGVLYGLFLKKKASFLNVLFCVLIIQGIISQFINTFFISYLYGSPYWPLFVTRIAQTAALGLVQLVCIYLIANKLIPLLKKRIELNSQ